jgi:hypothetical protein
VDEVHEAVFGCCEPAGLGGYFLFCYFFGGIDYMVFKELE